jgi:hypothetical protein
MMFKQHKEKNMNKTILSLSAMALSAIVASPAMAGTLSAEVRFGDVRGGQAPDSTEYKVEYTAPLNSFLNYGVELATKQGDDEGPVGSKVSARVGPRLPTVLGFRTEAYGEIGENLRENNNFEFWGAGVKTRHQLYGPVSLSVGYRHREAFQATERMTENRLDAGLAFDIGSGNSVGAKYYRTTGTSRHDAVGVVLSHSF